MSKVADSLFWDVVEPFVARVQAMGRPSSEECSAIGFMFDAPARLCTATADPGRSYQDECPPEPDEVKALACLVADAFGPLRATMTRWPSAHMDGRWGIDAPFDEWTCDAERDLSEEEA